MQRRFLLRDDLVRRIELELAALDPLLKGVLAQGATITQQCEGMPGRRLELGREDGAVATIAIVPFTPDPAEASRLEYMVTALAWAQVGGEQAEWRHPRQWTLDLSTPAGLEAAEPVIAEAWRQALQIDRSEIARSE